MAAILTVMNLGEEALGGFSSLGEPENLEMDLRSVISAAIVAEPWLLLIVLNRLKLGYKAGR